MIYNILESDFLVLWSISYALDIVMCVLENAFFGAEDGLRVLYSVLDSALLVLESAFLGVFKGVNGARECFIGARECFLNC